MKIKILEYKVFQGSKVKIQSHNLRKGKWIVNPKFELSKQLISKTPARFEWVKEKTREIK